MFCVLTSFISKSIYSNPFKLHKLLVNCKKVKTLHGLDARRSKGCDSHTDRGENIMEGVPSDTDFHKSPVQLSKSYINV